MGVSIEWEEKPAGTLRIHEPGEGFGSAYDWCCTIVKDGHTAVLKGAVEVPEEYREMICEELARQGFLGVTWLRKGKGWKKYSLRRWHGGNKSDRDSNDQGG